MKASKGARKAPTKRKKSVSARKKSATARAHEPEKAVDEFAAALKVFQRGDLARAKAHFKVLLDRYPQMYEIGDRVRTYLAVCERSLQPGPTRPREAEDFYHQGVFHLNRGDLEEAGQMLAKVLDLDPGSEKALYAQACVHARSGEREKALAALRRAIEANPSNRTLASNDADFDSLREDPGFSSLVRAGSEPAAG